jgi:hypothetical protein
MVAPTAWLPQLYQRYQYFWDRAMPAAGLALLLWASAEATGAFPSEWRIFLAVVLFLLGLARPGMAYVAFTLLIAYPLYRISIYVAAILLAVLILTSHWAIRNLGAAVLVLITPALLPWHLAATVPLLAGLWWGESTGAVAGGLAALWLKLLAGMAGQPLDLVRLSGSLPSGTRLVEQFSGLNSLQTLAGLFNPFADTSQALLLHLLQILAWGLAGYVAGRLARRAWSDRWRDWAPLLSTFPAVGVLWATYLMLPGLLGHPETDLPARANNLALWLAASALVSAAVRQLYLYARRPLLLRPVRRRSRRERKSPKPTSKRSPFEQKPGVNWTPTHRPRSGAESDDDLIMLEID